MKSNSAFSFMNFNSRTLMKAFCAIFLMVFGVRNASPFAFYGIREAYQDSNLGWSRLLRLGYPDGFGYFNVFPETSYAPHNLGDEYRWNVPVLYYSFDESFLDYFGSNGVRAVDAGAALLNAVTNVDSYSSDLSEWPLDEMRFNEDAAALNLFDLKSATAEMLLTRLGLSDPERFVFGIRLRANTGIPTLPCPNFEYIINQLNFDPVTLTPSRYVNGNLLTWNIDQSCPPDTRGDRASLSIRPVDPAARRQSAVASPKISFPDTTYLGMFHTSLTRDDVGGLRYLYSATNVNTEVSAPDAMQFQTNNTPFAFLSQPLALLAAQSQTNDAATLAGLFPGLVVSGEQRFFTNTVTTNITLVVTNQPWDPAFAFPTIVQVTTRTTNFNVTNYVHTFANTVTFQQVNGQWTTVPFTTVSNASHSATRQTVTAAVAGGFNSPFTPTINVTVQNTPVLQPGPLGEFAILPTNLCALSIVSAQAVQVTATNFIAGTNILNITNIVGTNVFNGQVLAQSVSIIDNYNLHSFVAIPVNCLSNTVGVRGGVQRVAFVRHDFDPLTSRFFQPITNEFSVRAFDTNGVPGGNPTTQRFLRIVTRPDIIFAARDADLTTVVVETVDHGPATYPAFNNSQATLGAPGPGTLEGPITLTFNKAGPLFLANNPVAPGADSAVFLYQWGSFDGSTNPPIVYPQGTTVNDLQTQMSFIISPQGIPNAPLNGSYSADLSVTGGQAPYAWSLVSNPAYVLPPGLQLTQDAGDSSRAVIGGTALAPGNYVFAVQVSDSGNLTRDMIYSLIVQ